MKHKRITEKVAMYVMSCSLEKLSRLTCYHIAKEFNINISYLSAKFKKDTKMSLFDFIEMEKIIRVRLLLLNRDDLTIGDISKLFGLEKAEQFRSKFKKFFYITPGKYRDLIKKPKIGGFT